VVCPWHGFEFDIRTGQHPANPRARLRKMDVRVEGGDVVVSVPWYEQSLWHMYDCTDYAVNLFNLPTIAYSGELDGQKQSADIMEKAMAAEGLKLDRIIGPQTKHAYEKNAKIELDKRLDEIIAKGRNTDPEKIRFTTFTLRYNHMFWVYLDGLEQHWKRARVEAERNGADYTLKTENVSALTVAVPLGSLARAGEASASANAASARRPIIGSTPTAARWSS